MEKSPPSRLRSEQTAISFSLYGTRGARNRGVEAYCAGVEMAGLAWRTLVPEARLLLFLNRDTIPIGCQRRVDQAAEEFGFRIFERGPSRGYDGSRWRMEAIWWDFDVVFPRDLDSLPTPDEVANMRFFLSSDRTLHLYRARFYYRACLAGLSGFRTKPWTERFPAPSSMWGDKSYARYADEERRLSAIARGFAPRDCVEAPQSVFFPGSLVPTREAIRKLTPEAPWLPRVAFAGKRFTRRRIERTIGKLRQSRTAPSFAAADVQDSR